MLYVSDTGCRDFRHTRASRLWMRGFFIDIHSSKEKTQDEKNLTWPDEPMHPRSEFSFTDFQHSKGPA
jgi:hypothetical protein